MVDVKGAAAGLVQATYRPTTGNRVKLYALASDDPTGSSGAFADLAQAIKAAQNFIFIADWSFQALTRLEPRIGTATPTDTVGHLLNDAATKNPQMVVAVHVWDHTSVGSSGAPDARNDAGNADLDAIVKTTSGGKQPKQSSNFLWRMTSRGGTFNSIHQKFVVLDADEGMGRRVVKVFMGGLDLTKGRFDFADHPVARPVPAGQPFAPTVRLASGLASDDWYNAEFSDDPTMPRQPWQDFYLQMIGPSAWDMLREFVGRWNTLGTSGFPFGPVGDTKDPQRLQVRQKFLDAFDSSKFVQASEPHAAPASYPRDGGPFQARIVRSLQQGDWGECVQTKAKVSPLVTETPTSSGQKQTEFTWKLGSEARESSIQNSYLRAIETANRFIYIENQYLIGSGLRWTTGVNSAGKPAAAAQTGVLNDVPGAIVRKIVNRITHDLDFHAYIVTPMFPEGDPDSTGARRQRFFEFQTMKFMALEVARAAEAKQKDWRDFLSFYCLANWTAMPSAKIALNGDRRTRVNKNNRYQIYVHSKLMIIDDEFLIVGSANLNERSLAGDRDTEIAVWLSADQDSSNSSRECIKDLRRATWSQHLDGNLPPDFDDPQKTTCSGRMQNFGENNWVSMAIGLKSDKSHLLHFPFQVDTKANSMFTRVISPKKPIAFADQDRFIFDAPATTTGPQANGSIIDPAWGWDSPSSISTPLDRLFE